MRPAQDDTVLEGENRVDGGAFIDYSLYNAETILGGTEP
jgi:hypothetical protein